MSNLSASPRQEFAAQLWDLAELVQGSESRRSFRSKAYRRAIWSLDQLSATLDDPAERILSVPGLGKGMVRLIGEFRQHGRLGELDDLASQYPEETWRLRQLPRMSPAILRSLKADAGVETTDDLVAAIDVGATAMVKGVGAATAERWLELLEMWERGALPAHRAWALAATMSQHLQNRLGTKVAIGGEVRRVTEWVQRLELLVASTDRKATREFLRSSVLGWPRHGHDPAIESFLTFSGIDLDVIVTTEEEWGTALVRITGPPAHVDQMEPLSEHQTEEAVYAARNLLWIPPPARESPGLDVATELIQREMIRGDLHVHSAASPDGRMTLEAVIGSLIEGGYEYGAVTDHTAGLRFGGLDETGLLRQRDEVERVRARYPGFTIFHGAEVNIGPSGALDIDDEVLDLLDIVVAGVHSHFGLAVTDQTERLLRAASHPAVRVLAHPRGRRIGIRAPLQLDFARVLRQCVEAGVALESNGHRDRLDLPSGLAGEAVASGALIAVNSDAHRPGEFENMENGVATLQRAGVLRASVVNALPVEDFTRWLSR